ILDTRSIRRPRTLQPGGHARRPSTVEVVVTDLQRSSAKPRHRAAPPAAQSRGFIGAVCALGALVVVLGTGSGWWMAHGMLGGITVSQALSSQDPKSTGNAMNVLLIGLD